MLLDDEYRSVSRVSKPIPGEKAVRVLDNHRREQQRGNVFEWKNGSGMNLCSHDGVRIDLSPGSLGVSLSSFRNKAGWHTSMKTTILPGVKPRHESHEIKIRESDCKILLAFQYIIVDLLFISVPVRTGHGGGGQGIGSAIAISLPAFTILFLLLFLFHLISIFQARFPVRLNIGVGIGQIIAGTLILGLLLFVRQSLHILQIVYPSAITLLPSLGVTLILGIYLVIGPLWEWHHTISQDIRKYPDFLFH
jgi:hypothetical protein